MEIKPITAKKVYAACFLTAMIILGIVPALLFVHNKLPAEDQSTTKKTSISLAKQYPYAESEASVLSTDWLGNSPVGQYLDAIDWAMEGAEQYLTAKTPFSGPLNNLNNMVNHSLQIFTQGSIVYNGANTFVKLPNGYLAGCFEYCPSPESIENILDFSAWLQTKGIPFVSLITPDKSDDSITEFPTGVPHGYSQMLSEYKTSMDENGVAYIEAKQVLFAENDDLYSWFYKSDHHWNAYAGYAMARETARVLNDEYQISADTDALDKSNFYLTVYPDSFLGSYGKKLGDAWKEDMEVFYPTGETSFRVEIPGRGIEKTGSFEQVLIDQKYLGTTSKYSAFMGGDSSFVRIENNSCQNGTRVLVVKYSFGNAFCPYLANSVQYLDVISLGSFNGSIRTFVEQANPDMVILCMGVPIESYADDLHLK